MTEIVLNCQNMACPHPVLECKKLIEKERPATFRVVVDNEAAKENVSRFLGVQGYTVSTETPEEGVWEITALGSGKQADCDCDVMTDTQLAMLDQKICVLITTETLGSGDDELGSKLMKNFLSTLPEMDDELWRVVLLNGAVRLTTVESHVIDELRTLEKNGVSILVCGTCLDHLGILEHKAVGETTNMLDVVTSLQLASKVIRP